MHQTHDDTRQCNLQQGHRRPARLILGWMVLWGIAALVPTMGYADGLLLGTYPLSSQTELDIKKDVTINGNPISEGRTGADSVIHIDGTRGTVSQTLPLLEPTTFPDNASNLKATEADSPFVSSAEVFFKEIKLGKNQSATFSGGGPFHIDELEVKKAGTLNVAAGIYFIDTLKIDKDSVLTVTSAPVIFHIGKKAEIKKDVVINSGGTVAGLRIFLHANAEFKGDKGLGFTGLIYGQNTKKVEIKKDTVFHGAIITEGEIKLDKDVLVTYTADDQAAVNAIDPADTGGGSNTPPEAEAGPDHAVQVTDLVQLDGSGSTDADGDTLSFLWTLESQPVNSTVALTNPTEVLPTLTIDEPGDYVVELIVHDGTDDSDPDTITLSTGNLTPVAQAGPDQTIAVTQPAFLDGTGSTDANGDALTYQWTLTNQPMSSNATLNDPASATPSFTVDQAGVYMVTLLVSDGLLTSETDLVIIATDNSAPVANAGPDHQVRPGTMVTLDGAASNDVDGNPLTYQWSQTVVPPGNTASISDPTIAAPILTPDVEGDYVAQLQVNDGTATSEPDTALIRVGNTAPIADAGPDQSVGTNTTVQLDGSNSSDPQGDLLTFQWTLTLPSGSATTLSDSTIAQPTFETDVAGTYEATLTVNDGDIDSPPDSMTVFVTVTTPQPTITGFTPNSASIGDLITLTGTDLVSSAGEVGQMTLVQQGGGTIAVTVTASSPTTLTFVVPSGAATGLITLTVAGEIATSSTPLTIVPFQTFDLIVEPGTVDVQQGQTVSVAIKATSSTGLTQLATLAVSGLPSGVTGEFEPPRITAGQTVLLSLTAPSAQVPSTTPFDVTATVNIEGLDVIKTDTGTLTVQPLSTSFLGRTVVANTLQTPLMGVTVSLLGQDGSGNTTGCSGQAISDAAGNFALTNLPNECAGGQLVRFNGSTATSPAGLYAGVDKFYQLTLDQVTAPPVLVHLPRIDDADMVLIQQNAPGDQTFTFSSIPNLSLTVYAGTIFTLEDGSQPNPFPLTAVEIATDRLPGSNLPTNLEGVIPFLVGFQPANTSVNQPVPVLFPNVLNAPPATDVPLVTLDPTQGIMVNYGTGTVSTNGRQIIPNFDPANPGKRFGLMHLGWHAPCDAPNQGNPSSQGPPPGPAPNESTNEEDGEEDQNPPPPEDGDPVDLSSGLFVLRQVDMNMEGGRGRIEIKRGYRPLSLRTGPFGVGTNHNYGYRLDTRTPQNAQVVNLILPQGNFIPFVRQANGTLINDTVPSVRGVVMTVAPNGEVDLRWKEGTVFRFLPGTFGLGSVLQSITDTNGNQTTLVRVLNDLSRILEIIDPVGRKLRLSYDQSDRILSIIDPIGRAVRYTYNNQGTLETVTNPEGGVTRYAYDVQNRMIQITDAKDVVFLQNVYDANSRVIEQIQADGSRYLFAYELLNPVIPFSPVLKTTVTDPNGHQTIHRFNTQGFEVSQTDALGQTTEFERESGTNLLLSRTDSLGRTIRFAYNNAGSLIERIDQQGNSTTFTYTPIFNQRATVTNAINQVSERGYDVQGNWTSLKNALEETATLTYNAFGQITSLIDPLGNTTTLEYDPQGNMVRITDPMGRQEKQEWDEVGRLISIVEARGFTTRYAYDALNRIIQNTDARNGLTSYEYDPNNNLTSITDAKDQVITFTYDAQDRVKTRADSLGRVEVYEYDGIGNLIQFTDRKNQVRVFTYDALNRRSQVDYEDGSSSSFSYDSVGRLTRTEDSDSGVLQYQYDLLNRIVREMSPEGIISYTYDNIGRRATMAANGQQPILYENDNANRLTQIQQGGQVVNINYDAAGRRNSLTLPNGTTTVLGYDLASRLNTIQHQGPSGMIESLIYTFDLSGNRNSVTRANSIATKLPDPIQADYDGANEQIQFNNSAPNLMYDLNGNLATLNDDNGTTTYSWDARDRLVAINAPGVSAHFTYDVFGRRMSKTVNGVTTGYHFDGIDVIAESMDGEQGVTYLRNLTVDQPFVRQGETNEYYHVDALGSTLAVTDDTGTVTTSYMYSPFGRTTVVGNSTNHFQFTGRENDETGLYYYRARYYSPILKRFIREDPIRLNSGDINFYGYVFNDPVNLIDPNGTMSSPFLRLPNSRPPVTRYPGSNPQPTPPFTPKRPPQPSEPPPNLGDLTEPTSSRGALWRAAHDFLSKFLEEGSSGTLGSGAGALGGEGSSQPLSPSPLSQCVPPWCI